MNKEFEEKLINKRDLINDKYLIYLKEINDQLSIDYYIINNNFTKELIQLNRLCFHDNFDNVSEILDFISINFQSNLEDKTFNYCFKLDIAYQQIVVNLIHEISVFRELHYKIKKEANNIEFYFNKIKELKSSINNTIINWCIAYDIELAYLEINNIKNVVAFSHRKGGWISVVHNISNDIKIELITNFGYGSASYFYILVTYKGLQLVPFSEWTKYRFADFFEINRYTKKYNYRIKKDKFHEVYFENKISNKEWYNAFEFVRNFSNTSKSNQYKFVQEFIIDECSKMVDDLEKIFNDEKYNIIENDDSYLKEISNPKDINGFALIEFKAEKIIGALEFIKNLDDCDFIVSTQIYKNQILDLGRRLIHNLYIQLEEEKINYNNSQQKFNIEKNKHQNLIYLLNISPFVTSNQRIFAETNILKNYRYLQSKVETHTSNINKIVSFINLYNKFH